MCADLHPIVFLSVISGCSSIVEYTGTIGKISGPPENVKRVSAAIAKANSVYVNPKFWDLVAERSWISSADPDRAIPGTEVAQSLRQIEPREQDYSFKRFGCGYLPFVRGRTNASTQQCVGSEKQCGHIYVNIKDDDDLGGLTNTIAHENTHVIGATRDETLCHCSSDKSSAYLDTPKHPIEAEVWMVSYGIGDLAQCFSENDEDQDKTRACFARNVNGNKANRAELECKHKSGIKPDVLAALRASAVECRVKKQVRTEVRSGL